MPIPFQIGFRIDQQFAPGRDLPERGEQRRREILSQANEDCAALEQLAETNMARAVEWIVERVVDG